MFLSHKRVLAGLLSVALAPPMPTLAADPDPLTCVVDDPVPGIAGHFEAAVSASTGDPVNLEGFATASGSDGYGWSLHAITPGGANNLLLLRVGHGRPSPGTYRILDWVGTDANPPNGQFAGTISLEGQMLGAQGFATASGRLTIIDSQPTAVVGCFEFSGRDLYGGGSLQVQGSFALKNQDY